MSYVLFLETNKKLASNNARKEWANLQSEDDLHWLCPIAFPETFLASIGVKDRLRRCPNDHYATCRTMQHTLISIYDLHLESSVI